MREGRKEEESQGRPKQGGLASNSIARRGQWPFRLESDRTIIKVSCNNNFGGLRGYGRHQMASEVKFVLRFEVSSLDCPGIHVDIVSNSHFGDL